VKIIIVNNGKTIPVEVTDYFVCGGVRLAVVKALEGHPFVGGDKWPVFTEYATVKVADLTITEDDQECHCVLPDQHCPACIARAAAMYQDIPFERK
jgi:hypothetical protein